MPAPIAIGAFSRITRLSAKALRLYDDMGLLTPARVDPATGYRYYYLEQTTQAELIRALRAVEMPLSDIQIYLTTKDEAQRLDQLRKHRSRLSKRLALQQHMIDELDAFSASTHSNTQSVELSITVAMEVASILCHTSTATIATDVATAFAKLAGAFDSQGLTPGGPPILISHDIIDQENSGDIEVAVPIVPRFEPVAPVTIRQMGACQIASIVHVGPFKDVTGAYHTLAAWLQTEQYELIGPTREVYLTDPRTVAPQHLKTRVEFPVASTETNA